MRPPEGIRHVIAVCRDLPRAIEARLARAAETTEDYIHRERRELLHLHGLGPEWEDTLLDLCGAYPIEEEDAALALAITQACGHDPAEFGCTGEDFARACEALARVAFTSYDWPHLRSSGLQG